MSRFIRSAMVGAVVAAVVAGLAVPSDASRSSVASRPLAVWQAGFSYTLGRVDPATLLPAGKQVGAPVGDMAVLSPARRWVALGSGSVPLVSVASASPLRKPRHPLVFLRGKGEVLALAWPRSHRLLVLAGRDGRAACCGTMRLYVVDPLKRRIVRSIHLGRSDFLAADPTPAGLAILLGGSGRLASARLLLVTQSGATRTVTLARFKVGIVGHLVTSAALGVGQGSAYVLGGSGAETAVAVVPLAHSPPAYHTIPAGPGLMSQGSMVVLPGGDLAAAAPTGLYVYDTHTWQQVGSVPFFGQIGYISGDTMIRLDGGSGIDFYNLDGSLRYHLNTPAQVDALDFVGDLAFLLYQDQSEDWGVLNLESRTLSPPVGGSRPWLIPGQPDLPAFAWTL
jgi:hypothetical protein